MKYLLIFCSILLFFGCKPMMTAINQSSGAISKRYDDLLPEDEVKIVSDYTSMISKKAEDKYIVSKFYPDTKKVIEYAEYKESALITQVGPSKLFSDFGIPTRVGTYSDGKKTGLEQNFHHKSGKLVSSGSYIDGEKQGPWMIYKEGKLYEELEYVSGKKEGNYSIYNPEGDIATQGVFKQDSLIETTVLIKADWEKLKSAPGKEGTMPLFGKGCPELENISEKKKCAEEKMLMFIYSNLRYPAIARENNVEGMAIAQFVVDERGKVTEIDLVKGLCKEIRDEVTRVIVKMPFWVPGEQDGEKVKVLYTLPVRFKLE